VICSAAGSAWEPTGLQGALLSEHARRLDADLPLERASRRGVKPSRCGSARTQHQTREPRPTHEKREAIQRAETGEHSEGRRSHNRGSALRCTGLDERYRRSCRGSGTGLLGAELTASVTNEAHTDAAIRSSNARTERTRAHEQKRSEHKIELNSTKLKRFTPKLCTNEIHRGTNLNPKNYCSRSTQPPEKLDRSQARK
jgi:hypothetical protein